VTRFLVIRHGQTKWNLVEKFRGRADIELDEVGTKQAEVTARRVAQWRISAIYSSPLQRAFATASILARHLSLEVESLPELIDVDYGEWQGLSPEEVAVKDSDLYAEWLTNPHAVRFPKGESLSEVRERVVSAVEKLTAQHSGEDVVLVSHKVVCQVFILTMLGMDNSRFWQVAQDVNAINLFEVRDNVPTAVFLNDTCHLEALRTNKFEFQSWRK